MKQSNIVDLVRKTKQASQKGLVSVVDVKSLSRGRQINVIQEPKVNLYARTF